MDASCFSVCVRVRVCFSVRAALGFESSALLLPAALLLGVLLEVLGPLAFVLLFGVARDGGWGVNLGGL